MTKEFTFYIESLDSGFTVKRDNKVVALEHLDSVESTIISLLKLQTQQLNHLNAKSMVVKIEVVTNPPKSV